MQFKLVFNHFQEGQLIKHKSNNNSLMTKIHIYTLYTLFTTLTSI